MIVLHGPSGIDKTLTAGIILSSIYVPATMLTKSSEKHSPLIALHVSNFLTEEGGFSESVSQFLDDADRLGAILLLDEADVTLESRSFEDIRERAWFLASSALESTQEPPFDN